MSDPKSVFPIDDGWTITKRITRLREKNPVSDTINIAWELNPITDKWEDGKLKERIWQTSCNKIRLIEVTRQNKRKTVAQLETPEGYKDAEKSDLGSGYVKYYDTLREAAEAAERVYTNKLPSVTNREDMLEAASKWLQGNVVTKQVSTETREKKMTVTANQVFPVQEAHARKLFVDLGMEPSSKGKVERLEKKLNEMDRWVATVTEPSDPDSKNLLRVLQGELEEGNTIKITPDEGNGGSVQGEEVGTEGEDTGETQLASKEDKEEKEVRENCIWEVVSEKLIKLTPTLVKRFHEMKPFPRDRNVKKSILSNLDEAVRLKEYRGGEYVSVTVKEVGETYRANGKHTGIVLTAWMEKGNELPDVKMVVREYRCATMEQAVDLYRTFDPQVSGRSKGDIIQCYANARTELEKISPQTMKLLTPAIAYAKWGSGYRKHSTEEQAHLMMEHSAFVVWFNDVIEEKKEAKWLWRLPVVVAMFESWKVDPDDASDFWNGVKFVDEDKKKTEQKLRIWLDKHKFGAGAAAEGVEKADDREGVYHCICAWNTWRDRENKTTPHRYPPKDEYSSNLGIPVAI